MTFGQVFQVFIVNQEFISITFETENEVRFVRLIVLLYHLQWKFSDENKLEELIVINTD